jgi:type II secretory pathway pseudopilin PulG
MTLSSRTANAGFALLEILVAFAIATTALGLLFRIHANSTATVVLSEEQQDATALALALIVEHSATESRLAFTKTGSADKYEWTVRATAYAGVIVDDAVQRPPYRLRNISAEVSWASRNRNRRIEVRTVKPFFGRDP